MPLDSRWTLRGCRLEKGTRTSTGCPGPRGSSQKSSWKGRNQYRGGRSSLWLPPLPQLLACVSPAGPHCPPSSPIRALQCGLRGAKQVTWARERPQKPPLPLHPVPAAPRGPAAPAPSAAPHRWWGRCAAPGACGISGCWVGTGPSSGLCRSSLTPAPSTPRTLGIRTGCLCPLGVEPAPSAPTGATIPTPATPRQPDPPTQQKSRCWWPLPPGQPTGRGPSWSVERARSVSQRRHGAS